MTGNKTAIFLIVALASFFAAGSVMATDDRDWQVYSEEANGDVHFFDASRIKSTADLHTVWNRIRYKTWVMGAASYQSLLEVDCAARTAQILQRTFFSDKDWQTPAMSTDMKKKPKRSIREGSAADRLSEIVCGQ